MTGDTSNSINEANLERQPPATDRKEVNQRLRAEDISSGKEAVLLKKSSVNEILFRPAELL